VTVFKEFEEYLGRDMVRVIPREAENGSGETDVEIHAEEIVGEDTPCQSGETFFEAGDGFKVYLDHSEVIPHIEQVTGEGAGAGTYFENGIVAVRFERFGNAASDGCVAKKMLSEGFFGSDSVGHRFVPDLCARRGQRYEEVGIFAAYINRSWKYE
jgi:hypothetical protein